MGGGKLALCEGLETSVWSVQSYLLKEEWK